MYNKYHVTLRQTGQYHFFLSSLELVSSLHMKNETSPIYIFLSHSQSRLHLMNIDYWKTVKFVFLSIKYFWSWIFMSTWKWYCFGSLFLKLSIAFWKYSLISKILSGFIFFTKPWFYMQTTSVKAFLVKPALTTAPNLKSNVPMCEHDHLILPYMYNVLSLVIPLSNL